ncbi:MAG: IS66 family transposase [Candidatus Omnitrophota bacterium]|nr:IS66 family transposase [Candidatus Omnitrophota bacterium]
MPDYKKSFSCKNEHSCPEVERLKEEVAYLRFELEEFKRKLYKPRAKEKPPKAPDNPFVPSKKKGGLLGHLGWFRKKPKHIDRIEEMRLTECPECGSKDISECKKIDEHIQEDIVLPRTETVLYRHHHYYCGKCKRVVSQKAADELPKSYIGPKAKVLAAFLKYAVKISDRDIRNIFDKVFGLNVVTSSISGFKDQLKEKALPLYQQLLESLKKSPFIHADETGWRIDGDNYWLWKFSNKKICVSHINKSRGQKVVEDILGKQYEGVLISDFLSAYNKITTKAKQRCLIHILRDLKKVTEYWHNDNEVLRYCKRLKGIFEKAISLYKEYGNKRWNDEYYHRRKLITGQFEDFGFPNPNKRILIRFAKRLSRHKSELFTFLCEKGVDYHNNHAEQQIRPDVIFRKITFGNRSPKGAENHSVLMTILQTAKLNKLDSIATLEKILLQNKGNPFSKILFPPYRTIIRAGPPEKSPTHSPPHHLKDGNSHRKTDALLVHAAC